MMGGHRGCFEGAALEQADELECGRDTTPK
jgi:hypothetical protein